MVDWAQCVISGVTAGWSVTVDPTVTYCGFPCLKITGTNTTTLNATITFPASVYFGSGKRFHSAVLVGDRAQAGDNGYTVQQRLNYSAGSLHIFQGFAGGSAWDGKDWSVGTCYDGELSGTAHISGTPVWAKVDSEEVTSMILLQAAAANVTEPIYVAPMFIDQVTPPVLTIFADGQYSSQYNYLRHALLRAGVRASFAIDVARVGDAGRMSLARGSWTKAYNRQCLALWKERYGEQVVGRVERLVKEKWGDSQKVVKTA